MSMTSHCGRCGSLMLSSITLAVWSKELLQRRWHVTRLPTQHTKAGDSPTTPRLVALTTSRKVSRNVELVQYLRPIRIRSFLYPGAIRPSLLENRAGFYRSRNAMRVRRGAAVHFDQGDRFVEQQMGWRPVDQLRCRKSPRATWLPVAACIRRNPWRPDIGC